MKTHLSSGGLIVVKALINNKPPNSSPDAFRL